MTDKVLNGMSVYLPIVYDPVDGPFKLNKDLKSTIQTNFKNLLFTLPGEKIMDPEFGIGIQSMLFDLYSLDRISELKSTVNKQINKYMPFLSIVEFNVDDSKMNENAIFLEIKYYIHPLDTVDVLKELLVKE
jgi:phage baseplate assembly protein W